MRSIGKRWHQPTPDIELSFPLVTIVQISLLFNWVISIMSAACYVILFAYWLLIVPLLMLPTSELIYSVVVMGTPFRALNSKYLIFKKAISLLYLALHLVLLILSVAIPSLFNLLTEHGGNLLSVFCVSFLVLRLLYDTVSTYLVWNFYIHIKID